MSKQIILTINQRSDYTTEECIEEALDSIQQGNTSGILGCSEDTWDLETKED